MGKRRKQHHETSHKLDRENVGAWQNSCKRIAARDSSIARKAGTGIGAYQTVQRVGRALMKDPSKLGLYLHSLERLVKSEGADGLYSHLEMARGCIKRGLSFSMTQNKPTRASSSVRSRVSRGDREDFHADI